MPRPEETEELLMGKAPNVILLRVGSHPAIATKNWVKIRNECVIFFSLPGSAGHGSGMSQVYGGV
jgi:hypothetical protein